MLAAAPGYSERSGEMSDERIVAKAEMLIRKPVTHVFEAFVDPMITSKFWFSRGSAKLEVGKRCAGTGKCTGSRRRPR